MQFQGLTMTSYGDRNPSCGEFSYWQTKPQQPILQSSTMKSSQIFYCLLLDTVGFDYYILTLYMSFCFHHAVPPLDLQSLLLQQNPHKTKLCLLWMLLDLGKAPLVYIWNFWSLDLSSCIHVFIIDVALLLNTDFSGNHDLKNLLFSLACTCI